MSALEKLRKELNDGEDSEAVSPVVKTTGLISPRKPSAQKPAGNEDALSMSKQWISAIRSSASTIRSTSEKAIQNDLASRNTTTTSAPTTKTVVIEEDAELTEAKKKSLFDYNDSELGDDGSGYGRGSSKKIDFSQANTLQDLISITEAGDYTTLFGNSERGGKFAGVDVSKMTLGELKSFSSPDGEYGKWVKDKVGRVATPMGKYQIVGTTLRKVAEKLNLGDDVVFSPKVQDQMFEYLRDARLASSDNPKGQAEALRNEWEGLKNVPTSKLISIIRKS